MFDPKTRVLVVDDMTTMRKIVMKSCGTMGFSDFTEAADGRLAWEALTSAKEPIGLIISDWNMPNCTGLDFLKRVRGDSRFKHIPFVLVTAETEKAQVIEAVQAGVSGYVVKPFTPDQVAQKLEEIHQRTAKAVA